MPPGTVQAQHVALNLPADFRTEDIVAFHRRDAQQLAEQTGPDLVRKGLLWHGHPASLTIRFTAGHAELSLALDGPYDGPGEEDDRAGLTRLGRRMLGLDQPVAALLAAHGDHPQLGPLLKRAPGRRVPVTATPFEALSWAITGQQISVEAAVAIRRKLIQVAGRPHASGLWCYPDAAAVAACPERVLREAGLSQGKTQALLALSAAVLGGDLPLDAWADTPALPVDDIRARLQAVRGIGPWTINYALLRGFGWLDGSLHGDAAVRRKLRRLLAQDTPVSEQQAADWLAAFAPWRALVATHLWALPD